MVNSLITKKLIYKDLKPEIIQQVANKASNFKIEISSQQLSDCIDPIKIAAKYDAKGGPESSEVKRVIIMRKKHLYQNQAKLFS
jgi:hypothetical protein